MSRQSVSPAPFGQTKPTQRIKPALTVLGFVVLIPHVALAANLPVTTLADEQNVNGECSLREALLNFNSKSQLGSTDCPFGSLPGSDDMITSQVAGTIKLTSQLPMINSLDVLTTDGGNDSDSAVNCATVSNVP